MKYKSYHTVGTLPKSSRKIGEQGKIDTPITTISLYTFLALYRYFNTTWREIFTLTLFSRLSLRISILLTCGKHLHDHIILLRGDLWSHKTSLTPPCCIEVPVQSQESVQWYSCDRGIDLAFFSDFSTGFWKRSDSVEGFAFHFLYIGLILWPTGTTWHSDSIYWCIKFVDGHPLLRCLLFHSFAWEGHPSHLIAGTKSWS
jgi:hypothetical protein